MSGDRGIRDALAEALWRADMAYIGAQVREPVGQWGSKTVGLRAGFLEAADRLLAALPTVSLKIVREA